MTFKNYSVIIASDAVKIQAKYKMCGLSCDTILLHLHNILF